jgi:protoporphyrinogen oxidase
MRVAILGGGVAGVVLAHELARSGGFSVTLLERSATLGGLHRSVEIGGVHYDIGAFLFDRNHELLRTFPMLYDSFVPVRHRSIVVTRHHTLDTYPMSMSGYLRDNGLACAVADAIDLLRCKLRHRRRDSLVSYVHYYLGGRIYRQSGLKAYIERFYATPDSEVDLEFALQRLDSLPKDCGLRRNFRRIIREAFNTTTAEQSWECYVRPREGFAAVYGEIGSLLRKEGVDVVTSTSIERVERCGGGFRIDFAETGSEQFDLVVSTIPIGTMMRLIGQKMERPPEGVRLVSLCYRFNGDSGLPQANLLYNFTSDGDWKRLNIFSMLYGRDSGDDYFVVECTQRGEDRRTPGDYRRSFERHLRELPLLKGELKYQGEIVTEDAYPFFRRNDLARIERARRSLEGYGIALAGRQGEFAYMNADRTALASKMLAGKLTDRVMKETI